MKKTLKNKVIRKVLNPELKEYFKVSQFRIDLNWVKDEDYELAKQYVNRSLDYVFTNKEEFDKNNVNEYLKIVVADFIFTLYKLKVPKLEDLSITKKSEVLRLDDAIEKYLEFKKSRVVINTFKTYNPRKNYLLEFFKNDKNIRDISVIDVENYQKFLQKKGYTNNAINNIMSFATSVFNYLLKRELIQKNVFTSIEYLQKDEIKKEQLEDREVNLLINNAKDINIRLAIKIASFGGFRVGEVLALKVEDINLKEMSIASKIKDTRNKKHTRTNPIHPKLLDDLKEKIGTRKSGVLLFENETKATTTIIKDLNRFIRKFIPSKTKTFHSLRSSFASKIEDYNLKDIKILLGHSNHDITVKSYLKSKTNWAKKVEMINSISYK